MANDEPFHWCCCSGAKRLDNHWLLWGRPRSRFPMQGMVGPDWRVGAWTFCSIPSGTAGWACLILFGAPDDGGDAIRRIIVLVGAVLAVVTMSMYLCTACTDPGIVFKHAAMPVTAGGVPGAGRATAAAAATAAAGAGGGAAWVGSAQVAPAGAGTPVPARGVTQGSSSSVGGKKYRRDGEETDRDIKRAAIDGRGRGGNGAGIWGDSDLEAQRMLEILTDDYHEESGHLSSSPSAAAPSGLPPDECVAAAEAGASGVVDMRNAPPPATPGMGDTGSRVGSAHQGEDMTACGRCQIMRPPGAIHCALCGVCVEKLDHHCPFMGQCVGRKTLAPFYVFVVTVWVLVVYVLLAVAYLVAVIVFNGL